VPETEKPEAPPAPPTAPPAAPPASPSTPPSEALPDHADPDGAAADPDRDSAGRLEPPTSAASDAVLRNQPLNQVLAGLGIQAWDLLLVGDGSGSTWKIGGGWAVVVIESRSDNRRILTGSFSSATSMRMELFPYIWALDWYATAQYARLRALGRPCRTHILCDNETTVKQGNGEYSRRSLSPWWAALDALKTRGFTLRWHWVARDTLALNSLCDHLSRHARRVHEQHCALGLAAPNLGGLTVYDFNPR